MLGLNLFKRNLPGLFVWQHFNRFFIDFTRVGDTENLRSLLDIQVEHLR